MVDGLGIWIASTKLYATSSLARFCVRALVKGNMSTSTLHISYCAHVYELGFVSCLELATRCAHWPSGVPWIVHFETLIIKLGIDDTHVAIDLGFVASNKIGNLVHCGRGRSK